MVDTTFSLLYMSTMPCSADGVVVKLHSGVTYEILYLAASYFRVISRGNRAWPEKSL